MLSAIVYAELLVDSVSKLVVWDHTTNSLFDEKLRLTSTDALRVLDLLVTDVSSVVSVDLLYFFVSREYYALSINNDNVVASVNVRCVNWLMLSTEEHRCFACYLAEDLVCSIDDVPLALYVLCSCGECFHCDVFLVP